MPWQLILKSLLKHVAIPGQINDINASLLPRQQKMHLSICVWTLLCQVHKAKTRPTWNSIKSIFQKAYFFIRHYRSKQLLPVVSPTQLAVLSHAPTAVCLILSDEGQIFFSLLVSIKTSSASSQAPDNPPLHSYHIPKQTLQLLQVFTSTNPTVAA